MKSVSSVTVVPFASHLTPSTFPPMTAIIPDKNDPNALARTENQTSKRQPRVPSCSSWQLTRQVSKEDGLCKHSLANKEHY